jgi:hypothetical protein
MIDCNLENLQKTINNESYKISEWIWGKIDINPPFQIKPREFLQYAENDLKIKNNQYGINCLSNCKRGIESQIDTLLYVFGLHDKLKREKWNFPKKIEVLNQLGVISPRILIKINKLRNELEHEYAKPDLEKVEDAVDITSLFLNYTDKFLKNFPFEFSIKDLNDYLVVTLDFETSKIIFTSIQIKHRNPLDIRKNIVKEVDTNSKEYLDHLKWFLDIATSIK